MEQLYQLFEARLAMTSTAFVRYLYPRINWDSKLIVILGARGVGKTTMVLQRILFSGQKEQSLYISADNTYFSSHSLFDTASRFYREGGKILYIDEVHKYPGWSAEVKMMYDNLRDLKVVATGSSILEIARGVDADLSRRAIPYTLEGLSFREYANLRLGINIPVSSLEDILSGKYVFPTDSCRPIALFKDYLSKGYFPFFQLDDYALRLENVINQTLEVDIPSYVRMTVSTSMKLKKLMYVISRSVPFKPNFSEIGRAVSADRSTVSDYLVYMEKAGLIQRLMSSGTGMSVMEKVEKVYLDNTNFIYALTPENPEIGNIRETFFQMALRPDHKVTASPVSDFVVDGHTFEVGGKGKTSRQIQGIPDAYIVKDDIEYAHGNVIPLWAFGLNY